MAFKPRDKNKVLEFVDRLDDIRVKGLHTDIALLCDGIKIPAHKVILSAGSVYFRDLFELPVPQDAENEEKEKRQNEIEMNGMSVSGLEPALRYIYAGKFPTGIENDNANLKAVLVVADVLQLPTLVEYCRHNLMRNVSLENCLELLDVSETKIQGDCMQKYAGENYDKLQHTKRFLELSLEDMSSLLTCAKDFQSSDTVFSGIIRWIKREPTTRMKNLLQLANCLNVNKLSNEYLHFLGSESVINDHLDTLKILYQTCTSRLINEDYSTAVNSVDTSVLSSSSTVNDDDDIYSNTLLEFIAEKNDECFKYTYYLPDNLWLREKTSIPTTSPCFPICSVGNFIYLLEDSGQKCKYFFKYHRDTLYTKVLTFPYERYTVFSAVDLRKKIYFHVSTKIACFNPTDCEWSTLKSDMPNAESKLFTCAECLFCFLGDSQSLIRFHPESKLTTVHEIPPLFNVEGSCEYASCNRRIYFRNVEENSFIVYNCVDNAWESLRSPNGILQLGEKWRMCTVKKELPRLFFIDSFDLIWQFQPKSESWKRISDQEKFVKNLTAIVVRN